MLVAEVDFVPNELQGHFDDSNTLEKHVLFVRGSRSFERRAREFRV